MLDKFFAMSLLLLCLFPYVTPFRTSFDTQPYAVALSVVALAHFTVSRQRAGVPSSLLPLAATALFASALLLASAMNFDAIRPVVGYFSAFTIAWASYHGFDSLKARYFVWAVLIWLTVGLTQRFIHREFGDFILSRMSTTSDRGVTGLAVEPSFYAVMCMFFLMLNDVFAARGAIGRIAHTAVFLMICVQLALASSALGFILFGIYLAAKTITAKRFTALIRLSVAAAMLGGLLLFLRASVPSFAATRLGRLTDLAMRGPAYLISSDASVSDRAFAVLTSHVGFVASSGLGYGLDAWSAMAPEIARSHTFIQQVTGARASQGEQIMSGWGAGLFQLGMVGLLPLISLVALTIGARRVQREGMRAVILSSAVTLYFVMLMAVPFAFPMFGFTLGIFACLGHRSGPTPGPVEHGVTEEPIGRAAPVQPASVRQGNPASGGGRVASGGSRRFRDPKMLVGGVAGGVGPRPFGRVDRGLRDCKRSTLN